MIIKERIITLSFMFCFRRAFQNLLFRQEAAAIKFRLMLRMRKNEKRVGSYKLPPFKH